MLNLFPVIFILVALLTTAGLAFLVPVNRNTVDHVISQVSSIAITVLKFPEQARLKYAERMANAQPVFNDRLLPGEGKNHALDAMVTAVVSNNSAILSVLQQVGDTFS